MAHLIFIPNDSLRKFMLFIPKALGIAGLEKLAPRRMGRTCLPKDTMMVLAKLKLYLPLTILSSSCQETSSQRNELLNWQGEVTLAGPGASGMDGREDDEHHQLVSGPTTAVGSVACSPIPPISSSF